MCNITVFIIVEADNKSIYANNYTLGVEFTSTVH